MSLPDSKEASKLMENVSHEMKKEFPLLKTSTLYQGKSSIRFRLKYISSDFKYPFNLRVDFTQSEKPERVETSPIVTKFPIVLFPTIANLPPSEILAEKLRAFWTRARGRDIFDLWFLFEKGNKIDIKLVRKKFDEINQVFEKEKLIKKLEDFPEDKMRKDLNQFLPEPQRKISDLKSRLLIHLAK